MAEAYHADQNFEQTDIKAIPPGEYDNCTFTHINFAAADLRGYTFLDCVFANCDMSNAVVKNTGMKTVQFDHCKLMGIQFTDCSPFLFAVGFKGCQLDYCSFYRLKMEKTVFEDCRLPEADFVETDLTEATFANCDLSGARFDHTVLHKADLHTANNFIIHPEVNNIKKARFSAQNLAGLLQSYDIVVA